MATKDNSGQRDPSVGKALERGTSQKYFSLKLICGINFSTNLVIKY